MKKILNLLFISIFTLGYSQIFNGKDLSKLSPEERHEILKKLSPEQKRELAWQYRENLLIEQLKINKEKQDSFKKIYRNYQQELRKIKDGFNPKFDAEKLTEKEAEEKLAKSFEVGEKFIHCRKKFAQELRQSLSPQQILRMYQIESEIKDKMMKKHENNKPKP